MSNRDLRIQINAQERMIDELRLKIASTCGGYPVDAYACLAHALIGLAALYQAMNKE